MLQNNYTTGKRKFKHLTMKERGQIEILLKEKMAKIKIAKIIGISRSTLYEEIKRGTVEQKDTNLKVYTRYYADAGQRVYEANRKNSINPLKLMKAFDFVQFAEKEILERKQSPDSVCGRAKKKGMFEEMVCTKTLYNYIDKCLLKVRNIDLPIRVKLNTKTRKSRENRRILGQSIENRPVEVNDRMEFGHWEGDTVVGTRDKSEVLLTLDERVSRKIITVKIPARDSLSVNNALQNIFSSYGDKANDIFKTITFDNGSEFADLSKVMNMDKVYFAHPNSSFERGTNEKQNSLIRRFFPKGKSLTDVSPEKVVFVQNWINDLPRKILNYSTPSEVFSDFVKLL